jgi:hypothetical protein
MSRHRMPQAVALLIALTSLAPATTQAQFGGLAKKAAQKAAERAVEKKVDPKVDEKAGNNAQASNQARQPSAIEITDSTYVDFARGLKAELVLLDESESYDRQATVYGRCRDSTTTKRHLEAMSKDLSAAEEKKKEALDARHGAAMQKAMQPYNEAAVNKAKADYDREFNALYGIDVRADSVAVAKKCPTEPRKPAWITEANALPDDDDQIEARGAARAIVLAGIKASGMTPRRYALHKELVVLWYQRSMKQGTASQPSGAAKRGVIEAHWDEIMTLRRAIGF